MRAKEVFDVIGPRRGPADVLQGSSEARGRLLDSGLRDFGNEPIEIVYLTRTRFRFSLNLNCPEELGQSTGLDPRLSLRRRFEFQINRGSFGMRRLWF